MHFHSCVHKIQYCIGHPIPDSEQSKFFSKGLDRRHLPPPKREVERERRFKNSLRHPLMYHTTGQKVFRGFFVGYLKLFSTRGTLGPYHSGLHINTLDPLCLCHVFLGMADTRAPLISSRTSATFDLPYFRLKSPKYQSGHPESQALFRWAQT